MYYFLAKAFLFQDHSNEYVQSGYVSILHLPLNSFQ